MIKKITATTVRSYNYGAVCPTRGLSEAMRQHYLKHRHWNALTYWELHRRWRVEALLEPLIAAGMTRKEAFGARKLEVKELDVTRVSYVRNQRQAAAREGLYYPGYMDVETAWNRARVSLKAPKLKQFDSKKGSLNFPLTSGLHIDRIYGNDKRVQIDPVAPGTYDSRASRRKGQRTLLRLRIGTQEREPVWLELPIFLHRPLPANCNVRDVRILWRTIGTVTRWSVSVTVREQATVPRVTTRLESVAVDLAWRNIGGQLRACYWRGTDTNGDELRLDKAFLKRWGMVEELQSIRDRNLATLKTTLITYLSCTNSCPEWLLHRCEHIERWRSQTRFLGLLEYWRQNRWNQDEDSYKLLEAWGKREFRLHSWQANLKDKLMTERRERYRVLAAQLATRYDALVLEAFDLRAVAQLEQQASSIPRDVRRRRVIVAPSILRQCLENAFGYAGKKVIVVEARGSSTTCHICGSKETFDAAVNLTHICGECGNCWDQDDNACQNFLKRASKLHLSSS